MHLAAIVFTLVLLLAFPRLIGSLLGLIVGAAFLLVLAYALSH